LPLQREVNGNAWIWINRFKNSPPLCENGDGNYNAHAFPICRGAEEIPVRSKFICFLFLPNRMSDLGHLKQNQRVIVNNGMVFGKNGRCFAFLKQLLEGVNVQNTGTQFHTLPVATNHRGDSGTNHNAAI
jgi:hypothetical protein